MAIALKTPVWNRNLQADDYLELLLMAAASTVVITRIFLSVTGYPEIGGQSLHIAHVLWGGLAMLAALIVMMGYISDQAWRYAAVLGGVGFGLFVDEAGKYLTRDNNYFYRPTASLIYLVLIGLYLLSRVIGKATDLTPREVELNHLIIDSTNQNRLTNRIQSAYNRLVHTVWAGWLFKVLLAVQVVTLIGDILITTQAFTYHHGLSYRLALTAALVALGITVIGIVMVPGFKQRAYQLIRIGVLIDIFVIQIFSFYLNQPWALVSLGINFMLYSVIQYDAHHGYKVAKKSTQGR
ncbi:MAG TPA: hypothetical protein VI322_04190 [Candidatus Saccharimonadia bacterium]